MTLTELVRLNRSYRSFDESRIITRKELTDIIGCARLVPSASNRQPLKYVLSADGETNARIQPLTAWAAKIRPQYSLPPEGHKPTAFIVVCVDTRLCPEPERAGKDVGIAAQTILLRAAEMGLGGCMIGAFRPEIKEALSLPEYLVPSLVIALGKPDEEIVLEDAEGSADYYRDGNGTHHVPKRTAEEIVLWAGNGN